MITFKYQYENIDIIDIQDKPKTPHSEETPVINNPEQKILLKV